MIIPIQEIYELTEKLKKTYDEKDIEKLAKTFGILVERQPMGLSKKSCKGYYFQCHMIKHITINNELHIIEQDIILTHEFGHAVMNHKATAFFYDSAIFNETDRFEMCANYFTADWLVEDKDVLELASMGRTFFEIASELNVMPELLSYKYRSMEARGHKGLQSPIDVSSRCLNEYQRMAKVAEDFDGGTLDD